MAKIISETKKIKGILSGFSPLYAIFTVGCLALFILVLFMPNSWLHDALLALFGIGFIALIVYACIRERSHPETFAVKQIQRNVKE